MEPNFGTILKQHREAKGLSIRQVSVAIKMNPTMIQDIEEGNFDKLPQPVFLRGLVKTYCKYLNIDETEVLNSFDSTTKYEKVSAKRANLEGIAKEVKTPTYVWLSRVFLPIFIITVLAATGTIIVLVTKKYDKEIKNITNPEVSEIHRVNEASETETSVDSTTTTAPTTQSSETSTTATNEIQNLTDKKITQVITLEPLGRTMVQVKIDDGENQKIVLRPDINKTFQAYNKIKLIIQDGGSVNIIYNNKDIGVPGVFGQEIELNFPETPAP